MHAHTHTHNGKANHKMADAHQRGQITNDITEANHKQAQAVRGVQTQHKRAHTQSMPTPPPPRGMQEERKTTREKTEQAMSV